MRQVWKAERSCCFSRALFFCLLRGKRQAQLRQNKPSSPSRGQSYFLLLLASPPFDCSLPSGTRPAFSLCLHMLPFLIASLGVRPFFHLSLCRCPSSSSLFLDSATPLRWAFALRLVFHTAFIACSPALLGALFPNYLFIFVILALTYLPRCVLS